MKLTKREKAEITSFVTLSLVGTIIALLLFSSKTLFAQDRPETRFYNHARLLNTTAAVEKESAEALTALLSGTIDGNTYLDFYSAAKQSGSSQAHQDAMKAAAAYKSENLDYPSYKTVYSAARARGAHSDEALNEANEVAVRVKAGALHLNDFLELRKSNDLNSALRFAIHRKASSQPVATNPTPSQFIAPAYTYTAPAYTMAPAFGAAAAPPVSDEASAAAFGSLAYQNGVAQTAGKKKSKKLKLPSDGFVRAEFGYKRTTSTVAGSENSKNKGAIGLAVGTRVLDGKTDVTDAGIEGHATYYPSFPTGYRETEENSARLGLKGRYGYRFHVADAGDDCRIGLGPLGSAEGEIDLKSRQISPGILQARANGTLGIRCLTRSILVDANAQAGVVVGNHATHTVGVSGVGPNAGVEASITGKKVQGSGFAHYRKIVGSGSDKSSDTVLGGDVSYRIERDASIGASVSRRVIKNTGTSDITGAKTDSKSGVTEIGLVVKGHF